jgi:hypothetical protein
MTLLEKINSIILALHCHDIINNSPYIDNSYQIVMKKVLTIFFILLTISIGLFYGNLPVTSSYAQNNSLYQSGNGDDAEQGTGQVRASDQDNQVVSGDSSVLSGNNLLCQDQENDDLMVSTEVCTEDGLENLPPGEGMATLKITTIQRANCSSEATCPPFDGEVRIISYNGAGQFFFDPKTRTAGGVDHFQLNIPIGMDYNVEGVGDIYAQKWWKFEGANIQNEKNSCSGWPNNCSAVMHPDGASVIVNFHYICLDISC